MSIFPFDDRDGTIWLDGRLVPWREAKVHVLTHGLHYASSVFEGIRAYGGEVFALAEHCRRLCDSARILGFDLPYDVEALEAAVHATLQSNSITDGYLRPVAWRGSEQMSISAPSSKIHVAIAAWDWPSYYDPEKRMRGIRLQRSRWARPAPNTAPTSAKAAGLYMICTMAKHEALAAGFDDALMLDWRGLIAEATGANIFLVTDRQLLTPRPDCFLDGITRRTVMKLARELGMDVVERPIGYDELGT